MPPKGVPRYKRTKQRVSDVIKWATIGLNAKAIAPLIGVCYKTVLKHHGEDIRKAQANGVGRMMAKQYKMGVEGDRHAREWWLEKVAGFGKTEGVNVFVGGQETPIDGDDGTWNVVITKKESI